MKRKKIVITRIVLGVLLVLGLYVIGRTLIARKDAQLKQSATFKLNAKPVQTVEVKRGNLIESYDYLAIVEPFQTANISARVTGVITKVHHQEGDNVKAGETLLTLDDKQIHDAIATVKTQIKQADAENAANTATLNSLKITVVYWLNEKNR